MALPEATKLSGLLSTIPATGTSDENSFYVLKKVHTQL
jgi:hypothetical protein